MIDNVEEYPNFNEIKPYLKKLIDKRTTTKMFIDNKTGYSAAYIMFIAKTLCKTYGE